MNPIRYRSSFDLYQPAQSLNLYDLLRDCGQRQAHSGQSFYDPLHTQIMGGVRTYLMPAEAQGSFDFLEGLQRICSSMGLAEDSEVWWVGGDLTGIFLENEAKLALQVLHAFIDRHFAEPSGRLRSDRLLISEYAGPEGKDGKGCSAIRCVGKLLKERPELGDQFLPYGVVTGASWFQSIGAIPHEGVKQMYVVHGDRPGTSDAWDSNGLARNALILEGGSRTLGYIFEIVASGGQVIGVHGFRSKTADYFDAKSGKFCLSAARFVSDLIEFLKQTPDADQAAVMQFWNAYIETWLPYNPHASDAHTKQKFIDEAWALFHREGLIRKLSAHFTGYSSEEFLDNK